MPQIDRRYRDFALRAALIAAILLTVGRLYGTAVVRPLLPSLSWVVEAAGDRLRVDRIDIVERPSDTVIQLKVTPTHLIVLGEQVLLPGERLFFEPRVLLGSVAQPLVIFFSILMAWPVASQRLPAMRFLWALPAAALITAANVPLGLVGAMQDYRPYFPNIPVPPLVYWNDFLQTGGSSAMAISAAILVLWLAGELPLPTQAEGHSPPEEKAAAPHLSRS